MVAPDAMSDFKFACPVCGQHITADSTTSGDQLECPTCFQKIVVPQAPATGETKFILSASQVSKPRPTSVDAAGVSQPIRSASSQGTWVAALLLLVVVAGVAGGLYVYRDRIFKPAPVVLATNAPASGTAAARPLNAAYPVPTHIAWTLDLTNAPIPEAVVAGRIHGSGFRCESAILRGGQLTLGQGSKPPWDLGLTVHLFARQGEELGNKTVDIEAERPRAPRVVLRWKDEQQQPASETFTRGYALKLAFGPATNSHISGQIYLCLPDESKSFVAGTFEAEIRKPPPPKPGQPKPPRRKPPPR